MKHGLAKLPLYAIWHAMVQRCTNPRNKDWLDYGGRGITVCDEWRNDVSAFVASVSPRPEGLWLDRIDNDKGYGPGNWKWSTMIEQANNRRPRSLGRNNKTGISGVHWHKGLRTYRVELKQVPLGSRRDFFEACCLRKSAEAKLTEKELKSWAL